jgi:hypothetical protein
MMRMALVLIPSNAVTLSWSLLVASAFSPEGSWCEATDDDNAKEGQHRVHRCLYSICHTRIIVSKYAYH